MPDNKTQESSGLIHFPDRKMERRLQTMLGALNRAEPKSVAMQGHLQTLIVYSAGNNWAYTTYFLEKALESLSSLDNGKAEGDGKWLK